MPELPEVETVRRTLLLAIQYETIQDVFAIYEPIVVGDFQIFRTKLIGQQIINIDRKGKYLIFVLTNDIMIIHLRMEGKFYLKANEPLEKHEHVIFQLSNKQLRYHDVRKFGKISIHDKARYLTEKPLNQLAEEPWNLNDKSFYETIKRKNSPIKSILLDQTVIAGLGNIYVDETLFLSRIHPTRKGIHISKKEADSLLQSASQVLTKAVELGGTTIRSYQSSLGVSGKFQNELQVHTKKDEPCPHCQKLIVKIRVGGRGTYVCTNCQT